jgi:hypothetical protein
MIKKIRVELLYYVVIVLLLAFVQHSDLLTAPIERFEQMQKHANYLHPFLYAFFVYIIIVFIRIVVKFILFLKNKFKEK